MKADNARHGVPVNGPFKVCNRAKADSPGASVTVTVAGGPQPAGVPI